MKKTMTLLVCAASFLLFYTSPMAANPLVKEGGVQPKGQAPASKSTKSSGVDALENSLKLPGGGGVGHPPLHPLPSQPQMWSVQGIIEGEVIIANEVGEIFIVPDESHFQDCYISHPAIICGEKKIEKALGKKKKQAPAAATGRTMRMDADGTRLQKELEECRVFMSTSVSSSEKAVLELRVADLERANAEKENALEGMRRTGAAGQPPASLVSAALPAENFSERFLDAIVELTGRKISISNLGEIRIAMLGDHAIMRIEKGKKEKLSPMKKIVVREYEGEEFAYVIIDKKNLLGKEAM